MIAGEAALLSRFAPPVAALARDTMRLLADIRPDLVGTVRTGWGSINYRHPRAGFVCGIFPMPDRVSLLFEQGRLLSSPLLEGDGRQVRFIRLVPGAPLPADEIAILLAEAIALRS